MATFVHPIGLGCRVWSVLPNAPGTAQIEAGAGGAGNYDFITASGRSQSNLTLYISQTRKFNGISWSFLADALAPTNAPSCAARSTSSFLKHRGGTTGATWVSTSELYNGTSWSYVSAGNYTRLEGACDGSSNAAITVGGQVFPNFYSNTAETYNGSAWSIISVYPVQIRGPAGCGGQTNFLVSNGSEGSGSTDPTAYPTGGYLWNGSSWSSIANSTFGNVNASAMGSSTNAVVRPGRLYTGTSQVAATSNRTFIYNGTTWSNGDSGVYSLRLRAGASNSFAVSGGWAGTAGPEYAEKYQ